MNRSQTLIAFLGLVAACNSNNFNAPLGVGGIVMTASVATRSSQGDSVRIHIANTGSSSAFMARCGAGPLLLVQQFVNGNWTGGVQNFMCPAPTGPGAIEIDPGNSIDVIRFFTVPGTFRMTAGVSPQPSLDSASTVTSNSFDVP